MSKNESTITENHGEVFTKPSVIHLMLASCKFCEIKPSESTRILEPSCGQGEFLCAMLGRFLQNNDFVSLIRTKPNSFEKLFCGYEIQEKNAVHARTRLSQMLIDAGISSKVATKIAKKWVMVADFLTHSIDDTFDLVIGNPPYVRIEEIDKEKLKQYRNLYSTMTDRADLFIPFFEKSLKLLKNRAKLCFICTDRWTKNRYGRKLRALISDYYSLDIYIDFYGADAFSREVITYPSITVIRKQQGNSVTKFYESKAATKISNMEIAEMEKIFQFPNDWGIEIENLVKEDAPWILGCPQVTRLIEKLEKCYPTIEEASCKVNIGAATGNNRVFIVDSAQRIEKSRRLKCLTAKEISESTISWAGNYLVNPYDRSGLVSLAAYPLLNRYLQINKKELLKRHVAKRAPEQWYKTIDRIFEERANLPKLLIPDIKDRLTIVYDSGEYYPNNSIYYVTSKLWPLIELGVILKIIGPIFLKAYSTKMAGGHLRFQAQHLRRIRIPHWPDISPETRKKLSKLANNFNIDEARKLVASIYALSTSETKLLQ